MSDFNPGPIMARIEAVKRHARLSASDGLRLALEHLLQVSRARTPIEEGTLERSGRVTINPGALEGSVSFHTPYAARQHEELDWQHDAGRTAKYLEIPMTEERDEMLRLAGREIRSGMGT